MSDRFSFRLLATEGKARSGVLTIRGISVPTPVFMPVGTKGTVKAMTNRQLTEIGYALILGNTYHLALRPGDQLIHDLGGLARFIAWDGLILTDSGGFQAFSLQSMRKQNEDGFVFRNHLDGKEIFLSPEKAIQIQQNLQSDIAMCLDYCIEPQAPKAAVKRAVDLTTAWAKRCLLANDGKLNLFGIVQGSIYEEERQRSLEELADLPFQGMAIGGVSVGEEKQDVQRIVAYIADRLPATKPRYLMGVGEPKDLLFAIEQGVDMFDCVLPTRNARNGDLFTRFGRLSIKRQEHAKDPRPIDEDCGCYTCQNFSRAYLRHLFLSKEILAGMLNSHHNLYFLHRLMQKARQQIELGTFSAFRRQFLELYSAKSADQV